jgi:hypothetical protein
MSKEDWPDWDVYVRASTAGSMAPLLPRRGSTSTLTTLFRAVLGAEKLR